MTRYAILVGQIHQDLHDLERLVEQTLRLLRKAQDTADDDYLGTVALNLHGFYSGTERIFREIARTVDRSMPEGSDWHRRLLRQMSAAISDVRPAIITEQTRFALDEYCAFRHVVRNIYTFDLRPSWVIELAEALPNLSIVIASINCYCKTSRRFVSF
jgi:hypothetical protein